MKKYMMADVNHEEFVETTILTKSQDQMADEKAKSLAIEAKAFVDHKKNGSFSYGLTEEQYHLYVSKIEKAAKATFHRGEVAEAWKNLCWAIFDDYMFDGVVEYEDAVVSSRREITLQYEKKLAQKLEKKSNEKKQTLFKKAARALKRERRW